MLYSASTRPDFPRPLEGKPKKTLLTTVLWGAPPFSACASATWAKQTQWKCSWSAPWENMENQWKFLNRIVKRCKMWQTMGHHDVSPWHCFCDIGIWDFHGLRAREGHVAREQHEGNHLGFGEMKRDMTSMGGPAKHSIYAIICIYIYTHVYLPKIDGDLQVLEATSAAKSSQCISMRSELSRSKTPNVALTCVCLLQDLPRNARLIVQHEKV